MEARYALKQCPFCGSSADLEITSLFEGDTSLVVSCTGCGCELLAKHNATEQEAITAWNQREERTCKVEEWREDTEIEYDEQGYTFSCCGHSTAISRCYEQPNYCPNCGAKVVEYMGVDVLVTYDADFADLLFGDECEKVERIVRCRDCKHEGSFRSVDVGWPDARIIDCEYVDPYGFCAWGERREDA